MLNVNTLAAARIRPTPITARPGGRSGRSAAWPLCVPIAIAKASTNSAIAVSLNELWARKEAAR
jgi:hypothetical protein